MRAIVLDKFGGLDSLVYAELPEPEPMEGHVVIEIKAFGIVFRAGGDQPRRQRRCDGDRHHAQSRAGRDA